MPKPKANGRPKREPKPRQPYLSDEMKPPSIPVIDEAAERYVQHRDARMAELQDEIKAHDALLALMRTHSLKTYTYEGNVVTVTEKTKVKVERAKDEAEDE